MTSCCDTGAAEPKVAQANVQRMVERVFNQLTVVDLAAFGKEKPHRETCSVRCATLHGLAKGESDC